MTTTERIANAIKGILEEDRRADRERIAELERDAAHFASVEKTLENWQEIIDDLNKQLDEAHKENARLVLERDFYKGAAPSAMQAAAPGQTSTATGGVVDCNFPACGPRCKKDCPPLPVVEEQGPWVIRTRQGRYESRTMKLSTDPDGALQFPTKEAAEKHIANFKFDEWDAHQKPFQVMTVAEARVIEAKRG